MTHIHLFQQARHLLVIKELPTPYPRHTQKPKALITFKRRRKRTLNAEGERERERHTHTHTHTHTLTHTRRERGTDRLTDRQRGVRCGTLKRRLQKVGRWGNKQYAAIVNNIMRCLHPHNWFSCSTSHITGLRENEKSHFVTMTAQV